MKKTVLLCLLFLFLCSGCALLGHNPNRDAKLEIFNSPDWSVYDTRKAHSHINIAILPSNKPYVWTSSTNPDVEYTIRDMYSYLRSNYFARDFTLVKLNKKSGATVTTRIVALKKQGLGGSDMPGKCTYDVHEFSFCML